MVEWKGRLKGEVGQKASNLERIENFPVPNFFVITPEELEKSVQGDDRRQILNSKIDPDFEDSVNDAYDEIGMSSEVRNANGRAKNLVGGQRNNQLVSVRASTKSGEPVDYELNVGSKDLVDSVKKVAASFYEKNGSMPAIIIQKMVEPDYSGAAMLGGRNPDLMEIVQGLGVSLEEGENSPYFYIRESGRIESSLPEEHIEVSRNPMNGGRKRKNVEPEEPFESSEVKEMFGKLESENLNVKFAYKRGDFYIVDAWKEENNYEILKDSKIQGVKVSPGKLEGEVGREVEFSDETLTPDKYRKSIVSKKGGYTSRDAERAREVGKPAVFSFNQELRNGQRINMEEASQDKPEPPFTRGTSEEETGRQLSHFNVVASEIMPLNPGRGEGVHISPPYDEGYKLTDRGRDEKTVPTSGYVDSYRKAFGFEGEKLILDARKMENLEEVIDYIEAELKIMVADSPEKEVLVKAIEEDFDVFASDRDKLGDLEESLAEAEKAFILEKLRDL